MAQRGEKIVDLIADDGWERITLRLTRIAAATLWKHNLSTETAPDVAQEIILELVEGKIGAKFVEQLLEELEGDRRTVAKEAESRLVQYLGTVTVRRVYKRAIPRGKKERGVGYVESDMDIEGPDRADAYDSEDLINQYLQDYEDDETAHDVLEVIARDSFERRKDIAVHLGLTEAQVHAAFKRIRRKIKPSVAFRVSPRTMQMLGQENISSPVVAVLEMVKNAYDADADHVVVQLRQTSHSNGTIVVEDNGDGMDANDIVGKWLVISTQNKTREPRTANNRVKVGEKGIGRLAMNRLGDKATIISKRDDGLEEGLRLTIDWTQYNSDSGELQTIKHPLEVVTFSGKTRTEELANRSSGTSVVISKLRDRWRSDDYEELHRDLTLLVSPFDDEVQDFKITFECDESPQLSGRVGSHMAEVAEYVLDSRLSSNGRITHILRYRSGETERDERAWHEAFAKVLEGKRPACGPLRMRLYFYLRDAASLKDMAVKRAELKTFLDQFQGVRIYRDGFRVRPYGDPKDKQGGGDWLGLNRRKISSPGAVTRIGGYRVSENQVVASVLITKEHNLGLKDQTNREGLFKNQAYQDLRRFVIHGIQFLELERSKREEALKEKQAEKARAEEVLSSSEEELKSVVSQLKETTEKIPSSTLSRTETAEDLKDLVDRAERVSEQVEQARRTLIDEKEESMTERRLLLGLASLGVAMVAFGHETQRAVSRVTNRASILKKTVRELPDEPRQSASRDITLIEEAADRIEKWGRFALDHVRQDKRTRTNVNLNDIAKNIKEVYSGETDTRNIKVELNLDPNLPEIRAFPIDMEGVLINLFTNAIEALNGIPLEDRKIRIATSCQRITAESRTRKEELVLSFADSGRGISEQDMENIFNPLFSTKTDAKGDPVGTGMGLPIIRSIVEEDYNGRVEVESHSTLEGAEFIVYLPLRIRRGRSK